MDNVSGNFSIAEHSSHSLWSLALCKFTSVTHGNFMPQHLPAPIFFFFFNILASFFITESRRGVVAVPLF